MKKLDMNWLREHVCYESADVFLAQTFPLATSVGEGFEFELDGKLYRTRGEYDERGRRVAEFHLSSYAGYCAGASHWYCRAYLPMENVCTESGGCVFGYLGGVTVPRESQSVVFDVCRPLTQLDIIADPDRWENYEVGDHCTAFNDRSELLEIISGIQRYFGDGWSFRISG